MLRDGAGTHTGSATPVMAIGGFLPMQIDDAFRKKINNDAGVPEEFHGETRTQPALGEKASRKAGAYTGRSWNVE